MNDAYRADIEAWLRPDETIEYRDMACKITREGRSVFAGSLSGAFHWQLASQQSIINAKLNEILIRMPEGT